VRDLTSIRRVSQIRQFTAEHVPDAVVEHLLELARWTGSSRNSQPWHFIVVRDRERLRALAQLRPNITWAANAPIAIAIVLDGKNELSEAYDEGRLTERLLTGATILGYGGGVAWFGEADKQERAKQILGVPAEKTLRQMVLIGRARSHRDPRPTGPPRGRKPLAELVSFERFGRPKP
jgi:nitroreductase